MKLSIIAAIIISAARCCYAACAADNCARAVTGSNGGSFTARSLDCVAFLSCTVTPPTSTIVLTATSIPPTSVATVTQTFVPEAATATITITAGALAQQKRMIKKRQTLDPSVAVTVCPTALPAYASACSNTVRYSSACSCLGLSRAYTTVPAPVATLVTTVALAAPVVTAEVTFTAPQPTVTVTMTVAAATQPSPISLTGDSQWDDFAFRIDLPFPIRAFGVTRSVAYVSTNGVFSFNSGSISPSLQEIPAQALPDISFAILWFDQFIRPALGHGISYLVYGPVGSRKFTVQFKTSYPPSYPRTENSLFEYDIEFYENRPGIAVYKYRTMRGYDTVRFPGLVGAQYYSARVGLTKPVPGAGTMFTIDTNARTITDEPLI